MAPNSNPEVTYCCKNAPMCFRGSCNNEKKKHLLKSCVSDLGTLFRLIGIGYKCLVKNKYNVFSMNLYKTVILAEVQTNKYIEQ